MTAAGTAFNAGADVTLFEKNDRLGKKLGITGKGRCNLTNNCSTDEFLKNVPVNPKFLYTAINNFSPSDTMNFFEYLGVPLKTERGNRVFPVSDKAFDIVEALRKFAECKIIKENVINLIIDNNIVTGAETNNGKYNFDAVIICTGGMSYPMTGSTGDGYKFARGAGIEVTPLTPSLVPVTIDEPWCKELQGLSLKNVNVKIINKNSKKTVYSDFGELMFTHFGVSGPTILSASAHIKDIKPNLYKLIIDLKPALEYKTLDKRILLDFNKFLNKNFSNALDDLLPQKLIPLIIKLSGIDPYKKINAVTQDERKSLVDLIKGLSLSPRGFRPIDEAVITSGGVSVNELDPKTMMTKKIKNLYFAGEVIDVDAYTGGFNLQIAFSTARLAAESACYSK